MAWRVNTRLLPLADAGLPWDEEKARKQLRKWASKDGSGEKETIDWEKYRRGFLVYNDEAPENFGSYKFPIAYVIDGKPKAVPRAISAAAAILRGGRGGTKLPEEVVARMKKVISAYYRKMGEKAPWDRKSILFMHDPAESERYATIAGYAVVWGELDLDGDIFTPETKFIGEDLDSAPERVPVLYNHGLDPVIGPEVLGKVTKMIPDEVGLWIEAQIDKFHKYWNMVQELVERGVLGWSPGTAAHLVRREAREGYNVIKVWMPVEFSLTPTPAQPLTVPVTVLKAVGIEVPENDSKEDGSMGRKKEEMKNAVVETPTEAQKEQAQNTAAEASAAPAEPAPATTKAAEPAGTTERAASTGAQFDPQDLAAMIAAAVQEAVKAVVAEVREAAASGSTDAEPAPAGATKYFDGKAPATLKFGLGEGYPKSLAQGLRLLAAGALKSIVVPINFPKDLKGAELEKALKAMGVSTNTAGGYLVPVEHAGERFIELLQAQAVVRRAGATVWPMPTETVNIPKLAGGATAYWVGENSSITASDLTFAQVQLVAKKLALLSQISRELMMASDPQIEDVVMRQFARAAALAEDIAYLRGDGTNNNPVGIRNTTSVTVTELGSGNGAQPSFDDLINAIYTLDAADAPRDTRAWIINPREKKTLLTLKDSNGNYLWNDLRDGSPPLLLGLPVFETTQIPTNLTVGTSTDCSEIYLGAWSEAVIGERMALELAVSDQAGTAFQNDQIWIRGIMRVGFAVRHPESFVVLTGVRP